MRSLFTWPLFWIVLCLFFARFSVGFPQDIRSIAPTSPAPLKTTTDGKVLKLDYGATDAEIESLEQVDRVESLQIKKGQITSVGLAKLSEFPSLRTLIISDTPLKNDDLEALSGMTRLEELALDRTGITGGLRSITSLTTLRSVSLIEEKIENPDLFYLSQLPELRLLYLNDTPTNDAGVANLKGCGSLQSLFLNNCPVTGNSLGRLDEISSLTLLDLGGTQINDSAFASIGELKNLVSLILSNSAVGDESLKNLTPLHRLTFLILHGTRVTNAGLYFLSELPHLESLDVSKTTINNADMQGLLSLRNIRYLDLTDSSFYLDAKAATSLASLKLLHYLILGSSQVNPEASRVLQKLRPDITLVVQYGADSASSPSK